MGLVLDFFVFFFGFLLVGWGGVGGGGRAYWLGYIAYRGTNQQKRKEKKGDGRLDALVLPISI